MKKKFVGLLFATVMTTMLCAGCGNKAENVVERTEVQEETDTEDDADDDAEETEEDEEVSAANEDAEDEESGAAEDFEEESNEDRIMSDKQLCDMVRTAVFTALFDPEAIDSDEYETPEDGEYYLSEVYDMAAIGPVVEEILGLTANEVEASLKSDTAAGGHIIVEFSSGIVKRVYCEADDTIGM